MFLSVPWKCYYKQSKYEVGRKNFALVFKYIIIYGLKEAYWLFKACKEFSTFKLLEITVTYGG